MLNLLRGVEAVGNQRRVQIGTGGILPSEREEALADPLVT